MPDAPPALLRPTGVATLERELEALLDTLAEGDAFEARGMPVPGLDALEGPGPGEESWTYLAPLGEGRALFDESHLVAVFAPTYDGFLVTALTARADLADPRIVIEGDLAGAVTAHHRTGPLWRGQQRAIDLELHPGRVPGSGISGRVRAVDLGEDVAAPLTLTLATAPVGDCVLAGASLGPWEQPAELQRAAADLVAGRGSARRLARRIEAVERGAADPLWSRLPWRRRR